MNNREKSKLPKSSSCVEKREKQRLGNYGFVCLDAVGSSIEHYINTLYIKDIILKRSNEIDRTMLTIRYIDKNQDNIFFHSVEDAKGMIKELMQLRNYFGNN